MKIIFIEDPGILGWVVNEYSNGLIDARYYLDSISYRVTLTSDEYRVFTMESVNE